MSNDAIHKNLILLYFIPITYSKMGDSPCELISMWIEKLQMKNYENLHYEEKFQKFMMKNCKFETFDAT